MVYLIEDKLNNVIKFYKSRNYMLICGEFIWVVGYFLTIIFNVQASHLFKAIRIDPIPIFLFKGTNSRT